MTQKEKIINLLKENPQMKQGELAYKIYGDNSHGPAIYQTLMQLVRENIVTKTGSYPAWYSLNEYKTDIDYRNILEYIKNNRELPYTDPQKAENEEDREKFNTIKENGQLIVSELKKIVSLIDEKYYFDKCETVEWLDGSKTKTKKYLQAPMKYGKYTNSLVSVSLYVEYSQPSGARFRVSLEIQNDTASTEEMSQYHSHLDIPNNGLVYVAGSNQWGVPEIINESQDAIKEKVKSGQYRKVQICSIISENAQQRNEYYEREILSAVERLMPYYEHVLSNGENDEDNHEEQEHKEMNKYSKNMILYGPPGTGKTFNTVIYAVAICEEKAIEEVSAEAKNDYHSVKSRYDQLLKGGRIAFTTFHQSYGYEEFIEGIKPDTKDGNITYNKEDGVFKKFCLSSRISKSDKFTLGGKIWSVRKSNSEEDASYLYDNSIIGVDDIDDCKKQSNYLQSMEYGDTIVFGRDFCIDAIGIIDDFEVQKSDNPHFRYQRNVRWIATNLNKSFDEIDTSAKCFSNFTIAKSKLKPNHIAQLLNNEPEKSPCVFIIDEINRGNISKIFGELITLIEDTKREGKPEAANAILPYTGDEFSVPDNVYILGTMNTADRSIALMDTALRRRFQFVELMPNAEVLSEHGADKITVGNDTLDIAKMLNKINERITYLYDREHTIGHAFFMKLKDSPTIDTLADIFEKSVIPLLQEYFYEDYRKIQLVLGDNAKEENLKFIKDLPVKPKEIFKGTIDDIVDLPEKKFEINKDAITNIQSYIQII